MSFGIKMLVIVGANLFLALLITLASEVLLRVMFPNKIQEASTPPPMSQSFTYNPVYLVTVKPNLQRTFTRVTGSGKEMRTYWSTNADSFRGNELRENGDLRIIVYGDSNILARFSNLEDTFPYKLEKELQRLTQHNIEVINAGVDGFGPDQSLLRFEQEVDVYKPDLVVFHVFADNDFGDIIRNRLFDLDPLGTLVKSAHATTSDHCFRVTPCMRKGDLISIINRFSSSLLTVRGFRKALALLGVVKTPGDASADALIKEGLSVAKDEWSIYKRSAPREYSHFADHYDYDLALFPDSESSVTKVKLMDAVLAKAKQVAQSKNVGLLVLIQPSSQDLTRNLVPNYSDFSRYVEYKPTNLSSVVEKVANARHIDVLNLFKVFLNNRPEALFFKGLDNHWNSGGQSLAARETALYIKGKLLKPGLWKRSPDLQSVQ